MHGMLSKDAGGEASGAISRRGILSAMGGAAAIGLAGAGVSSVVDESPAGASTSPGWHDSVRVATTAGGTLATSFAAGQTIDGVTLATGDRILIKNQGAAADNGIHTVNSSGAPTRAADFNTSSEIVGAGVIVEDGTINSDTLWICITNQTVTVGTTALLFEQSTEPLAIEVAASNSPPQIKRRAWATCDGTNDEQTIQLAINTASIFGGGVVHLYSGTYNVDAAGVIVVPSNVALTGDTYGNTVLNYTPTSGGACVTIQGASDASRTQFVRVSDLYFDGPDSGSSYGLFLQYAANCQFERLRFFAHRGHAIRAINFTDSQFYSCRFDYCGSNDGSLRAAFRLEGSASWGCDNIEFVGCTWESNEERDFDTVPNSKVISMLRFLGCKFENHSAMKNGAVADVNARLDFDGSRQVVFDGCLFFYGDLSAGATRGAAFVKAHNSAEHIVFVGCYFVTGGTGSSAFKAYVELASVLSANLIGNSFNIGSTTNKPSTSCFNYTGASQKVYRAGNAISFDGTPTLSTVLEAGAGTLTNLHTNRGVASVPAGLTFVVVSHNLHRTPTVSEIMVTPTATWGATTKWWVSGVGLSSFQINATPAPGGSGLPFAWQAVVPTED
jgi:hypothetical protein